MLALLRGPRSAEAGLAAELQRAMGTWAARGRGYSVLDFWLYWEKREEGKAEGERGGEEESEKVGKGEGGKEK